MKRLLALVMLGTLVLPNPPAFTMDPPDDTVVICMEGEWLNDAGDGCEPLPTEEDGPVWDCRTMGNLTCAPSYILRSGVMVK